MKARVIIYTFLMMFCFFAFDVQANPIELTKLDMYRQDHQWQFIFYLSAPTQYRIFRLNNPSRLVLDLKDVTTKVRLRYKALIDTPISKMRYSQHQDHIFRIVFDLAMPVDAKIQEVSDGHSKERKLELRFTKQAVSVAAFNVSSNLSAVKAQPSIFEDNAATTQPPITKKKT